MERKKSCAHPQDNPDAEFACASALAGIIRRELVRHTYNYKPRWQLHLAGDWFPAWETKDAHPQPHLMRAMLTANLAVDCRFVSTWLVPPLDGSNGV